MLFDEIAVTFAIERTWAEFHSYIGLGYILDIIPPERRAEIERIGASDEYRAATLAGDVDKIARLLGRSQTAPIATDRRAAARWVKSSMVSEEASIAAKIEASADPLEALGEWAGEFAFAAHLAGQASKGVAR